MNADETNLDPEIIPLEMSGADVGSMQVAERVMLRDVNWTVRPGEFWAIGGLQLSGKTDLLATCAGLLPVLRGHYHVFGQDLHSGYEQDQLHVRLSVGLVFESGRMLNHLSLADNVALPLRYHSWGSREATTERVRALLELVGLADTAGLTPSASGRNAHRRAGLARALALEPRVLLVDNPLSGLDPREAAWWMDLLDQLNAGHPIMNNRPLTLVVTGDHLRPWRQHARQFAVLRQQRFILLGGRENLAGEIEPVLKDYGET